MIQLKKNKIILGFLLAAVLWQASPAIASTTTTDYSMFKRSISPAYLWGENGVITIPKANPVGRYNLYVAAYGQEAGTIQGENLYYTRATAMLGTSEDVEIGLTRAQLLWENGDRTDIEADVFNIKARVLNLGKNYLPSVAIGTLGTSLKENRFNSGKDILLNPFISATIRIPLFTEQAVLSGTINSEWLYSNGERTQNFINIGADLSLFNDLLIIAAEQQGVGDDNNDAVLNVAAKLKLFKVVNIGVGQYNIEKKKSQEPNFVGFIGISLPIGDWTNDKN